jgi:hypothetical protein
MRSLSPERVEDLVASATVETACSLSAVARREAVRGSRSFDAREEGTGGRGNDAEICARGRGACEGLGIREVREDDEHRCPTA